MFARFVPLALVGRMVVACTPAPAEDPDATEGGGSDSTGDAPSACPATTAGPTFHGDEIVGHQIWRAEDGPHVVMSTIAVRGGATLEIEPCSVVRFTEGTGISVAFPGTPNTGTLLAEGTEDQPITFEGQGGARWGHVHVEAPGVARLAHVTMTGGGGVDERGATLVGRGDGTTTARGLFVDHVAIEGSLGAGAVLSRGAAFAEGSDALTITGSGSELHPFPLEIDEHAMGTLPDGEYTGNVTDEILVRPELALAEDATLRELGVPYRIGTSAVDRLTVGAGDDTAPAVALTIEPGVTLRFHPGTQLRVEHRSGAFAATGRLVAEGTAAAPITFTSAADTPAPGDWVGLWFGGIVDPATSLAHVRLEYTGADCGCVLVSCSDVTGYDGAVILSQPPTSMFLRDSVLAHGAGHGIVLGYTTEGDDLDFAATNTFEDLDGCDATLPSAPTCPDPRPTCG